MLKKNYRSQRNAVLQAAMVRVPRRDGICLYEKYVLTVFRDATSRGLMTLVEYRRRCRDEHNQYS
jgi:hypothetical protein